MKKSAQFQPGINIGQQIIRKTPSSTARQIFPNLLGVIGGVNPGAHNNQPDRWFSYGYFPVEWANGLWSQMAIMDKGYSWDFYPEMEPEQAGEEQGTNNENGTSNF